MIAKFKKTKKGSWQSILFSVLLGCLLLVVIGFLVGSNLKMNQKREELRTRIESLKQKIHILEEKNQKLKAGISQVSESEYLEKTALERLNLKPENTEVVAFVKEKDEFSTTSKPKGILEKFLEKLKFW